MQTQYLIPPEVPQVPPYEAQQMAQGLAGDLALFLLPLLGTLDRLLDKRLVRTFLQTIQVILAYRDRVGGLLLSELGGSLLSPEQAPAGSKRLSKLLHSPKWDAQVVGDALWHQASQQVHTWHEQGEEGLAIWEGSAWEKAESEAAEDLCAVRSSKACCSGDAGWCMSSTRASQEPSGWGCCWPLVCASCCAGARTTSCWMRQGTAARPGASNSWSERTIWDSRRAQWVVARVLALPVRHPEHPESLLWLLVCRSKGRTPWYLLTAEPISSDEDAWRVVFAYMRRWQSELTWRFNKSELAFESPRLWQRPEREKLLALATLGYAFLLHLLEPPYEPLRHWLLRYFCHRTGWHLRRMRAPLYRLRSALSRLWQRYAPCFAALGSPPPTLALVPIT